MTKLLKTAGRFAIAGAAVFAVGFLTGSPVICLVIAVPIATHYLCGNFK